METLHADFDLALRDFELSVDLAIGAETLALVGPSGAGKTTVLRAIAGLLRPSRGRVALGGERWFDRDARVDVAPERRTVGYVFQDYALFPHLTVEQNVRFAEAGPDVRGLLERFGVAHLAGERPGAISGGERQRVALARALARSPSVLLLDEPLAALDTRTRAQVRGELQTLLPELGLPTVLVTHDFDDAASLGDRIGVLQRGKIRQLGTPAQLLGMPADAFVAGFTGANLLGGVAESVEGGRTRVTLDAGGTALVRGTYSGRVDLAIHPWEFGLTGGPSSAVISSVVTGVQPHGDGLRVRCGELTADVGGAARLMRGERISLHFDPDRARVIRS